MNKMNLELKHYCQDFNKVRTILEQLGAKKEIVKNQKDYFFNLPENKDKISPRLKLRVEGKEKTLIYYERPDFAKDKKATANANLYDVKDNQLLTFLEKTLGVKAIVEKKRELWRKANTVFNLDTVKGVGNIFEIELQKIGKGAKITEKDKAIFKSYQDRLKPFLGDIIGGSNVDLVTKKK